MKLLTSEEKVLFSLEIEWISGNTLPPLDKKNNDKEDERNLMKSIAFNFY